MYEQWTKGIDAQSPEARRGNRTIDETGLTRRFQDEQDYLVRPEKSCKSCLNHFLNDRVREFCGLGGASDVARSDFAFSENG